MEDFSVCSDTLAYIEMTPYRTSLVFSPLLGQEHELLPVTRAESRTKFNATTVRERGKKKEKEKTAKNS